MSISVWLLPDDAPVGPWARAHLLLAKVKDRPLPTLIFRTAPDARTQEILRRLGVSSHGLGKKGLNRLASWWKLRTILRQYRARFLHVWELSDLAIAVPAAPEDCQVACEITEGQKPPAILDWVFGGPSRVSRWFCRGQVEGMDPVRVVRVNRWGFAPDNLLLTQNSVSVDMAPLLLVADSAQAVREGLWAFDIFKHAWPQAKLRVLASQPVQAAARDFARTLELGERVTFLYRWPDLETTDPVFAVVALGSGPWVCDAALRALSFGAPVLAERSKSILDAVAQGVPFIPVNPGDRAGLAAALQGLVTGPRKLSVEDGRKSGGWQSIFSVADALGSYGLGLPG